MFTSGQNCSKAVRTCQNATKVIKYLKHHNVSVDKMNKLPKEDNQQCLLWIKDFISSLPKNLLSEDLNKTGNAEISVFQRERAIHPYEQFSKDWTKKRN